MGGGTYAKSMPNCVAFGASIPGKEYKMHQNNEQIEIEDLVKATAIYAKAIYELIKEQDILFFDFPYLSMRSWWNGRHATLRGQSTYVGVSSNLIDRTINFPYYKDFFVYGGSYEYKYYFNDV